MRIVPLSAFKDNYIWALVCDGWGIVVDPGDATPVLAYLKQERLRLAGILLTHHHPDHIGGVADLMRQTAAKVPVFGPVNLSIPELTHAVGEGASFSLSPFPDTFSVLELPGHTASHIAFRYGDALFCGDTLFSAGCGRLLGGTASQLYASLLRLKSLAPATQIYCSHEYTLANLRFARVVDPDNPALAQRQLECERLRAANQPSLPISLQRELTYNPFLRCDHVALIASAEAHCGRTLPSALEVFTEMRLWKDGF